MLHAPPLVLAPEADDPALMLMHVADAARAFVELAEAPPEAIKTVNYIVLGPTPSPTAEELVDAIRARVPGAKLEFKVDPRVSAVVDAVGKGRYVDRYARTEWGCQHRFDLGGIIDSFTKKEKWSSGELSRPEGVA